MTQNYARPSSGDSFNSVCTELIDGVEDAATCLASATDPSSGGTWAATRVGTLYFDTTNQVGGGDGLGGETKRWEKTGATPTYGMRSLNLRGYTPEEPNTSILSLSATSAGWTDLDVSGATTSSRAVAIEIYAEVVESNPGAGVFAAFRKNGTTTDALERKLIPQVSNISCGGQFRIEIDSSQKLEYKLAASGNTSAGLKVALLGYYERI